MKTKKFIAPTLKEATEKMKLELGSEAIILSTRVIENYDNGFRKMFEIVSAYEDEHREITEILNQKSNVSSANNHGLDFEKKLSDFKTVIDKSLKDKNNGKTQNLTSLKDEIQTIADTLFERDLSKDVIKLVINYLKKSKSYLTVDNLDNYVITGLASLLNTRSFEIEKRKSGRVISIIGPTGVGKTTCIAKLAAISKIIHNLDIGIISIDTYRLGAIDQLRIFSEISNVDMLVAYEPSDMPKLIAKLKNKDLIFIDTTGRSQKNTAELKKMTSFFSNVKIDETYLALSMTSSPKNLLDAAEKFKIFNYDSFVFTKIDEAVTHGSMLNLSLRFQKPVIYLTNGQIIPDDILAADSEYAAKLIYNGNFN